MVSLTVNSVPSTVFRELESPHLTPYSPSALLNACPVSDKPPLTEPRERRYTMTQRMLSPATNPGPPMQTIRISLVMLYYIAHRRIYYPMGSLPSELGGTCRVLIIERSNFTAVQIIVEDGSCFVAFIIVTLNLSRCSHYVPIP
jgi:hypothetical protein